MSEENKAVLRRHFAEIWSQGNVALVDELFASDCLSHAPARETEGREGLKRYVSAVRTAFPDLHITVEDMIAEGDRVATRWTACGTHKGEFKCITQQVLASGQQGSVMGISIFRIANGKVVECWTNWDVLGVMQQLGVIPLRENDDPDGRIPRLVARTLYQRSGYDGSAVSSTDECRPLTTDSEAI